MYFYLKTLFILFFKIMLMLTQSQLMHIIFSVSDLVCKVRVDHVEDGDGGPTSTRFDRFITTLSFSVYEQLQPCLYYD